MSCLLPYTRMTASKQDEIRSDQCKQDFDPKFYRSKSKLKSSLANFILLHTQYLFLPKFKSITQHLSIIYYSVQLGSGLIHSVSVSSVNNEYQSLRSSKIVTPQRSDLVLSTDIPNIELDVLVLNSLNIELNF
jgi:hypothetical protein